MEYAPILISVYTRLDHLKRCIDSLKLNSIAKDSVLYIVSDAAGKKEHVGLVISVREYIRNISGFKMVELIERKINLGSAESIPKAIDYVFEKYDKLIFLEDDNFLSNNFLTYVNSGLDFYKDNKFVFSINGYNFPIKIRSTSSRRSFFFPGFCAWGVGIWRDKWNNVDMKPNYIKIKNDITKDKKNVKKTIGEEVYKIILSMCLIEGLYVDAIVSYHCYKNNLVSVFPEISKVRNYGHDGSGEHGGYTDRFINQVIDSDNIDFKFESVVKFDNNIYTSVLRYFKVPSRIKTIIALRFIYHKSLKYIVLLKNLTGRKAV